MFTRRFPTACLIQVATGELAGNHPLQLQSEGFLEFAIGTRPGSPLVDLRLVNAEANVRGFSVKLGDRELKIDGFTLTGADFDTVASTGEVDQLTNEGWFTLVFTIPAARVPALAPFVKADAVTMEITERGRLDVGRGEIIELHADPIAIPSAVPASLITGLGSPRARNKKSPSCAISKVLLGGAIKGEVTPAEINERWTQFDLIVCPGTEISLIGGVNNAGAVQSGAFHDLKAAQDVGPFTPDSNGISSRTLTPTENAEYEVRISNPGCAPKSGKVRVWMVKPGAEITIAATWNGPQGVAVWEGNPKFSGKNVFVTSIRTIDCSALKEPPIPVWDFQFTDRDGRVSFGEVRANYLPLPGGDLPLQGSSWVFDPKVKNQDIALAACFVIQCACR